jgi:hypothetical protein
MININSGENVQQMSSSSLVCVARERRSIAICESVVRKFMGRALTALLLYVLPQKM